jgi:hypothetical protein
VDELPNTLAQLLVHLEYSRGDMQQFGRTMARIALVGNQSNDPADREKSWNIITEKHWFSNINQDRAFNVDELAQIFRVVIIPELSVGNTPTAIATWALTAPPLMISGLLAAAKKSSMEDWQAVMGILEPVIAVRWASEHSIEDQWDSRRAIRATPGAGRDDSRPKRGNRLLRRN